MNPIIEQIITIYKRIPLAKRMLIGVVLLMLVAGFVAMFFWANKIDYQTLYTNLSPEDAGGIVEKLRQDKVPYQLTANGTAIMVPAEKVYDLRLSMASSGILKGNSVGFEIFDTTDFGTTEFVQKLNYQRALQGELARTIQEFREVINARVMIVMPKESVFVEESRPPAVVHLVASSVEGLSPDRVTVVDTSGKVLSQGGGEQKQNTAHSNSQLTYKIEYEQNLAGQIQSMLEQIVGSGKAIVRVTADMDFDQVDINEEIYDPDSQVVRSRQNIVESSDRKTGLPDSVSSVNPAGFEQTGASAEKNDTRQSQDETINYEINRILRRTIKPVGAITRLSVAAVLDGKYEVAANEDGASGRTYIDREDQVSVASLPLSYMPDMQLETPQAFDKVRFVKQYGRSILNVLIVLAIFLCVIRPLLKAVKQVEPSRPELTVGEAEASVPSLPGTEDQKALPSPENMSDREKAIYLAEKDAEKTAALLKSWVNEA